MPREVHPCDALEVQRPSFSGEDDAGRVNTALCRAGCCPRLHDRDGVQTQAREYRPVDTGHGRASIYERQAADRWWNRLALIGQYSGDVWRDMHLNREEGPEFSETFRTGVSARSPDRAATRRRRAGA